MLTTIASVKGYIGIVDPTATVTITAKVVGDTYNQTITGDGIQTILELVGTTDYNITAGGSVILGYQKTLTISGGDLVTAATFTGPVANATEDAFLLDQIEFISATVENYCGRKFEVETYVQTYYLDNMLQTYNTDLMLYHFPLTAQPTVVEVSEDSVETPVTAFRTHFDTAILKRTDADWFINSKTVRVTYTAGFAAIPSIIRSVVNALVAERYAKKTSGIGLNFGSDVQRLAIPGVMSIDFDYSLQNNERKSAFGVIIGNYANVLDYYRSERKVVGTVEKAYVS